MGAVQLQKIFQGLERSYGQYNPVNKTHSIIHQPLTLQQYEDHIAGKFSLGIIPINENNKACWGAIDIDDHKKDKTKPTQPWPLTKYKNLLDKIKFLKLPLNVFKSKSGGAHCILLLDQWYSAKAVQDIMHVFEYALGYEGLEIFPKQTTLGPEDSGSFLNLPYFKGNSRVLIDFDYKELNIEGLDYAIKRIVKLPSLSKFFLLKQGTRSQHRNDRTWCAVAYLKKQYPNNWEDKTKEYNQLFNEPPLDQRELENTIFKSHRRKEYNEEKIQEPPPNFWEGAEEYEDFTFNKKKTKELIGYDMRDYRKLPIEKPVFIMERLFKERSINFLFGPKGNFKTEYALGITYATVHGLSFLNYKAPLCYPVLYIDGEMDPYDIIEREAAYLEAFGDPPKDHLHIINFAQQTDQIIPDIKEPLGQKLILDYLRYQEKLVGIKPFLILDNLRSLSNYIENDSDSFRPIGTWLKNLRGLGYASLTLDHTGHNQDHMRGTSSKSDWANVCLKIQTEGKKGQKFMKVKLKFDKARGLKPEETDDFIAVYDFQGNWTLGQTEKEHDDDVLKKHIKELLKKKPPPIQKDISLYLKISVGKVNKLIKEIDDESEDSNSKEVPF